MWTHMRPKSSTNWFWIFSNGAFFEFLGKFLVQIIMVQGIFENLIEMNSQVTSAPRLKLANFIPGSALLKMFWIKITLFYVTFEQCKIKKVVGSKHFCEKCEKSLVKIAAKSEQFLLFGYKGLRVGIVWKFDTPKAIACTCTTKKKSLIVLSNS